MKAIFSLSSLFSRSTNDNKKSSDITDKGLNRALNPPNDNTQENLHGVTVKDPFRPLEKLQDQETAAWVARQNNRYDDFMRSSKNAQAEALTFLNNARPKEMHESMPSKYGDKYFVWQTVAGAVRPSLYIKDTADYGAPARLLLDPLKIDPSGKTTIVNTHITDDGKYVQANLRGGGEYGQKWYDDGRKENKQNVFDDFAACAEHLIKNKYTSNKRLAIRGGSNGGLLTLATMIQRPELFGAVVSEVPVADMFRFHIGSYYGYSWKSDYGDPSIKRDFNIAAQYSPLHNVKKGFKHPPLLIKTDANDDRVLPWHSYKMAATLQSKEDPSSLTLLKIRTDGGHSAGMTAAQRRADIALVYAFLTKTLGPINQQAYKAKLAAEQKVVPKKAPPPKKAA